jgi:hypothetical protein
MLPDFDMTAKHDFNLKTEGNGYHGLISEDTTVVNVTPSIVTTGEMVCGFSILTSHHHGDLPFEVSLILSKYCPARLQV